MPSKTQKSAIVNHWVYGNQGLIAEHRSFTCDILGSVIIDEQLSKLATFSLEIQELYEWTN
jgi:hypothetical protein